MVFEAKVQSIPDKIEICLKFYKVSKGAMGVVTADGSVLEIQSVQLPGRKVITAQQLMLNYPEILSLRLT